MPRARVAAVCPFTIVADGNELLPQHHGYRFESIDPPVRVVTAKLAVGDYTVGGMDRLVVVERKSLPDLYGSFSQKKRANMLSRIERMNVLEFAAIVVESDYLTCLENPPRHSKLHPRSLSGTILACQQRFPYVHWWFVRDRAAAEKLTFRILERFYLDHSGEAQAEASIDHATE